MDANDFALARVSHEIEGNRFAIKTNRGNVKVSWEVKATRNDAFVRAYGAPTEQPKPAELRGTYLQPELYGQPSDMAQFRRPVVTPSVTPAPASGN